MLTGQDHDAQQADKYSVLHLLPTISRRGGGVSEAARLFVLALADALPGRVEVLTTRDEFTDSDRAAWSNVPVHVVTAVGPSNFGFSLPLLHALFARRAQIVHVHGLWMFHCFAALIWARLTGGRLIVTVGGMLEPWILRRSRLLKYLVRCLFQDRLVARADRMHVLSEKERGDVLRVYPRAVTEVIPNFVDVPALREARGLPDWWDARLEGLDIFLFLGRLHEKKGCEELLQAWEVVSQQDTEFRNRSELVFCGWLDGLDGFADRVLAVAERTGNVRYIGPRFGAEKLVTLAAATFFILPSKSEGLPMSVLEAWAAGAIVVMTPHCNLPIGFEREAAIPTGTSRDEIAASLRLTSSLPAEARRALASAGRDVVQEFYSRRAVARSIVQLYANVADQPRGVRG
jgi:glycosyltransferase involved in cell wall biosynthesis